MVYITSDYYENEYKGKPAPSIEELERNILRASEVIDQITNFRIATGAVNLETSHPFIKQQVEKATAAMTEYYILNGGYETFIETNVQSAGLGSFNYTLATQSGKEIEVPSNVVNHLNSTGLMYAGINASGGGVYYDN